MVYSKINYGKIFDYLTKVDRYNLYPSKRVCGLFSVQEFWSPKPENQGLSGSTTFLKKSSLEE
jgi:hypothetical protein